MASQAILEKLLTGRVVLHPVTIPEGYNLVQIAEVLAGQQVTDVKEFSKLVRDRPFITTLGIEADSLEGYLFRRPIPFLARPKPVMSSKRWSTACIGVERRPAGTSGAHEVVAASKAVDAGVGD